MTQYVHRQHDQLGRRGDLEIPLNFLGGRRFHLKIFADGKNADKVATSVSISERVVAQTDKLKVHLAPGGGWAAIIQPVAR